MMVINIIVLLQFLLQRARRMNLLGKEGRGGEEKREKRGGEERRGEKRRKGREGRKEGWR